MRLFCSFAASVVAVSCAGPAANLGPAAPLPGAANGSTVVAEVGDRRITVAEADARAGDELFKLQEQLYELRTDAAERIAIELLVEREARKEHLTEDQWIEARLEKSLTAPTDADLHELFDKVRGRLPNDATFEDVKPQLRQALLREARGKRARELFDGLKKAAGYTVVLEEPARPRKTVMGSGPSRGDATAKVTIVEFADFQCPYCSKAGEVVEKLMAAYPGQVRLVYRHFPLSFHKDAPKAAEASMCADQQGKFWQFHDALYAHQDALGVDDLKGQAFKLGLDLKRFEACLDSSEMRAVVASDMKEGERLGVSGTPAFFLNGYMLSGAQPEEKFRHLIDRELAKP